MALPDAEDVKEAARGHWPRILQALAPDLGPALDRPGRHVPCPVHGGKDGFRVFRDVAETGGGVCNTCGSHGDGLGLLQWIRNETFPETLAAVAAEVGLAEERPSQPRQAPTQTRTQGPQEDPEAQRARLRRYWADAYPLTADEAEPARLFLARRDLDLALLDELPMRFHPRLPYMEEDWEGPAYWPAILAGFAGADGSPVTLHRTWVDPQGRKAPVPSPRKTAPYPRDNNRTMGGGAVRIGKPGRVLGVAEGIETALSITTALGLPTWACLSATLLEQFEPPPGVDRVIIWGDNDESRAGEEAARNLKSRLWEKGIQAAGQIPEQPGWDWNDVLKLYGPDGVPKPADILGQTG
mgnify:CR=1 FL=1